MTAPLVVSLLIDEASQARLDAERRAWFPPGRTAVGAHVTFFHALPGRHEAQVRADLGEVADRPAFVVHVTGVLPLGRGAAYRLAASELAAVHAELRERWLEWLTPQDRQPLRPHVTVQNKVEPALARETVATLRAGFTPWSARATGLALWRYAGGPWEPLARWPFY